MCLFGERGVLVDVSYLVTAEVFRAISADRAAVVLGHIVVIATVVLGSDGVALEHGVELGGALQRRNTVTPSGREKFECLGLLFTSF